MADKAGKSPLTGHHEKATGSNKAGKKVSGFGSTRKEAVKNCNKAGSVTKPKLKK